MYTYKVITATLFIPLLFTVNLARAIDPPNLISPTDNSQVSSSKLEWEPPTSEVYTKDPYKVWIDDDPKFESLNKDSYIKNNTYTPQLTNGTWYWKVKVRDIVGEWSIWSSVRKFTLTTTSPIPSPTPSITNASISSPSPTPQISTQPTIFLISNLPTKINSNQSLKFDINISLPSNPNTTYYLKGAFIKSGKNNYFGHTKVNNNWILNSSTYSSQEKVLTDTNGNWKGQLEVQPDTTDSGYEGSGDYIFKVARYTHTGSGPNWSNDITISIENISPTPSPSSIPSSSPQITPSHDSKTKIIKSNISNINYIIPNASIAAATTHSSINSKPSLDNIDAKIASLKTVNQIFLISGAITFIMSFVLGYYIYQKNKKINI